VHEAAQPGRVFYRGLVEALTQVMGSANGYLFTHGPRVANLARQLARAMGLSRLESAELVFAAVFSDVGMIGLAEGAWEHPTPELDPETRGTVERHPGRSESTLRAIPHLEALGPLVRHHHEWWDGSGYPDGLSGEGIPLAARILRLADTVCALEEPRPQRAALSAEEIAELVEGSIGAEFAPEVANVYLRLARGDELAEYQPRLFRHVLRRAAEELLPNAISPLSADQLLNILSGLIDAKDPYTAGHSRRVAILAVAAANQLGVDDDLRTTLWAAGYLHDLGKVGVPLRVLSKEGPLDQGEFSQIQSHAHRGASMLGGIAGLRHLSPGARYHHEKWDGSGYPEGLRGDHIPVVAQILAVCDAYDAMTSHRAYRRARNHDDAMREIALSTGRHFAPRVSASFLALPDHLFASVRQPVPERADFFPLSWGERQFGLRHRRAAAR
jgi:HD-GYP domain-containing protein (c-di-GMP phosphodiesterase class II)